MPTFIIGGVVAVICVGLAVYFYSKSAKEQKPEKQWVNWLVFVLSLVSLVISIKLFWNMGIYADEYGSSPVLVAGGWFWLAMDWLRLGVLFCLCVISGLRLIPRTHSEI
jgi:amino acid transporter